MKNDLSLPNPPSDWTTCELFQYCQIMSIISPEDTFEEWMNDRTDLLKFVDEHLINETFPL